MIEMVSHMIKAMKNREGGSNYSSNICQIQGDPNGTRPISDNITRVQEGVLTDNYPGVEAIGQTFK